MFAGKRVSIMTIRYLNQSYQLTGYLTTVPEFPKGWLVGGG